MKGLIFRCEAAFYVVAWPCSRGVCKRYMDKETAPLRGGGGRGEAGPKKLHSEDAYTQALSSLSGPSSGPGVYSVSQAGTILHHSKVVSKRGGD
jgi:hypothetical protein